jgi:hypothetical protein
MLDFLYVVSALAFFALTLLMVEGFERLRKGGQS